MQDSCPTKCNRSSDHAQKPCSPRALGSGHFEQVELDLTVFLDKPPPKCFGFARQIEEAAMLDQITDLKSRLQDPSLLENARLCKRSVCDRCPDL